MVLLSTVVFFHGTYRGAKSVVPRNTTSYLIGPNNEARYLTIIMVLFNIANKVKFKIKFH